MSVLALALVVQACKKSDDDTSAKTISVGALLSLTGNWSSLGITSKAALEIAAEDINKYMDETGTKQHFVPVIYDTKLDTTLALSSISDAKGKGYTFVIGPQSSAEVGAVKPYADANNMLVVSQGSTAGSLSIAGDNVFRFCPDDKIEGAAIANTIYKSGIKGLVTAARNDAGNKGLQNSTGSVFTTLGGNISATAPYATANPDFQALITDLKSRTQTLIAQYGASGVGIYLASFDECVDLFKLAANDPVLSSVNWYGGDGVTLSAAIQNDAAAAAFAVTTHFFAPTFGLSTQAQSKWEPLAKTIKSRTGIDPDAFALAAYDALWVIALTYKSTEGTNADFSKLKTVFQEQANIYFGATGPTLLNEAGDRALGSFDYWGLSLDNGNYKWKLVGKSE